jgi:7-cyano-7-deazaguanine synthase
MLRHIVALSGGMDSATLLGQVLAEQCFESETHREVLCVNFNYGSKHGAYEQDAAQKVADHYKVQVITEDFTHIFARFKSNLLKSGGEIPEGHYTDVSMTQTVVPGRNIIFLSYLAGLAWSLEVREIWIGVHQGDHAIYPDCRPEFFYPMRSAIGVGTEYRVSLRAPLLLSNKSQILEQGLKLKVPYQLTRSCYCDSQLACGRCGACTERLEAFAQNGVTDPITYQPQGV